MTEEEKEAIEQLKSWRNFIINNKDRVNKANDIEFYLRTTLNLIQKQQEEIEKLRNKNKDLLRKLRNRVKEVKKLIKYSLYKEEFSRLNTIIEQKNRMIDEISKNPYNELRVNGILFTGTDIKQYFAEQAKEVKK